MLIEYSDFQCPFCGTFARDTLPSIEQSYVASGRVLLAFRNVPIEQLHPLAFKAAEAAQCAGQQGKFWEMHNLLFKNQKELDESSLVAHAAALKLDSKQFGACLAGDAAAKVRQDRDGAQALAITGTPTFLVGIAQQDGRVKITRRITGAQPLDQFRTVLDGALATK